MTIIIALIVFILWTVYRFIFPENLLLEDLVTKPIIWFTPIYIVCRFRNLGFSQKSVLKNLALGLLVGLVFSFERIFTGHFQPNFSFAVIISALCTALTEEIFFRGYLLNRWLTKFKNPVYPLIFNGLFFTATHLPVALFIFHYTGYNLFTYILFIFISGFINVFLFYQTKSIYAPIANHFVWNVFSGIFR
jgi:membrane protease YdiL (CAAX protease family)